MRTNGYQAYTQGEHGHWICMTKMSQLQEQIYDKVLLSDSKNDSGSSDIRTTSGSSVAERHEMYLHGMAWHHYLRRPSAQSTIACRHPGSTTPGRVSLQVRAFVCISFVQTKKRGKSHWLVLGLCKKRCDGRTRIRRLLKQVFEGRISSKCDAHKSSRQVWFTVRVTLVLCTKENLMNLNEQGRRILERQNSWQQA